jgi:CheY-like chemotaxis protein
VSNGDDALARLDSAPPDIVLADVAMPGRSGYEVAQYVKRSPQLSHIPVVLLTGAFEPVDEEKATAAGCDGVLAKPFEPQLVIGRVKQLLEHAVRPAPQAPFEPAALDVARQAGEEGQPAGAGNVSKKGLDDYFDRLDAAFASRSDASTRGLKVRADETPPVIDWIAPPVDEPLAPAPTERRVARAGQQMSTAAAASPIQTAPAPIVLPPLADAFAALLAAEQGAAVPSIALASSQSPSPRLTDEAIDDLTRRVMDRLAAQVPPQTVIDIVSSVAERLVREEIERIKSSIK